MAYSVWLSNEDVGGSSLLLRNWSDVAGLLLACCIQVRGELHESAHREVVELGRPPKRAPVDEYFVREVRVGDEPVLGTDSGDGAVKLHSLRLVVGRMGGRLRRRLGDRS